MGNPSEGDEALFVAGVESETEGGVRVRRSDRVTVELPIQIGGTDASGMDFFEGARTLVVSKHGAKIASRRVLSPNQELMVSSRIPGKEAAARIVGELGRSKQEYFYGLAFLEEGTDVWGIEFPELTESEKAEARVLLECAVCHSKKVAYLNAFEAEVLAVHERLSIYCRRCVDATIWKLAPARQSEFSELEAAVPHLPPARPKDERRQYRTSIEMRVCLRHPQLGEEVTETADISRGGFRFRTHKYYTPGAVMEAALPYAPEQANIFCPVEVEHSEPTDDEGWFCCGVSYIRAHHGWPRN